MARLLRVVKVDRSKRKKYIYFKKRNMCESEDEKSQPCIEKWEQQTQRSKTDKGLGALGIES